MPDPAESLTTANEPATAETQPVAETPVQTPEQAQEPSRFERLLEKADVPEVVKQQLREKHAKPQVEAEVAEPAAEEAAEPAAEEPEKAEEPKPEGEPEEHEEATAEETQAWPKKAVQLKERYRKERNTYRTKASELEAKLKEAEAKLEKVQTPVIAPTFQNPLSDVKDFADLTQRKELAKAMVDFCRKNPDGWTDKDGNGNEVFIDRDKAVDATRYWENILHEAIPAKAWELQERPKYVNEAKAIAPKMYESGTEEATTRAGMFAIHPWLHTDPAGERLIALAIKGLNAQAAEAKRAVKTNGKPELEVPKELKRVHETRGQVPVLKNLPPNRTNGVPVNGAGKQAANAYQEVLKTGDREAITNYIRARREANANGKVDARSPALV